MKSNREKLSVTGPAVLALLLVSTVAGQPQDRSPSHLIAFLNYESDDRRGKPRTWSCGEFRRNREAAKLLAKVGEAALPSIAGELDSIEESDEPERAAGAGWLLFAFAKIEGPAAYPRLRRMIGNPKFSFLGLALDSAIALSLGMTSYVSSLEAASPIIDCGGPGEPRRALNQLILGWEKNDRRWFEGSLGPRARASLRALLNGRTWGDIRKRLWDVRSSRGVAVGYQFEIAGRWSEPDETLEDRDYGELSLIENPQINVVFKDRTGTDCGRHLVIFTQYPMLLTRSGRQQEPSLPYVIDNSDLADILSLISSCAAR